MLLMVALPQPPPSLKRNIISRVPPLTINILYSHGNVKACLLSRYMIYNILT